MRTKFFLLLASLAAIGLPAALYFFGALPEQFAGSRSNPLPVVRVKRVELPRHLKVTAELLPLEQVEIVSRLAGRLREVRFKPGDRVAAGNIVAVIHSAELEERLARAHAAIRAAESELRARESEAGEAERRATTQRELAGRHLIARREVEEADGAAATARAAAELARAHLAQQQAMLAQVQALQGLTILRAPIAGQVIGARLERGAAVAEGAAILTVGAADKLRLTASVGVADVYGLSLGAKARMIASALPEQIFEGEVSRITAPVNEFSEIEVRLDNHQRRLQIGMAVEASIELDQPKDGLFIPRAAVLSKQGSTYVYKIAGNKPLRQPIVVGRELGDQILVLSGLAEDDSILLNLSAPGANTVEEKSTHKK